MYSDGDRIVQQMGERTKGGACAHYQVVAAQVAEVPGDDRFRTLEEIRFQSAPIPDVGVQGVTNECLLAIVADRLQSFQNGDFPCEENAEALEATRLALRALEKRTADRRARGVDGQSVR